ncbi:antitoxin Xre-like helix-turn-helix domain-containing protein [Rhodanobacter denitrificans]|uniref:antitoxin Xre-like helix-turn-helix domain-containing protein n=1 Tax=Rhodanobacter denitrificans TaxID=666685 RepID=UPI001F318C1A|nr:antitoxin Xre/MbcA/ParS toxin-binding domain-containing protein [Rhodanobacter denitrificans]UJJ60604.1 DUF2384 domain-containing protein [Rhodanobacter denitrificans]
MTEANRRPPKYRKTPATGQFVATPVAVGRHAEKVHGVKELRLLGAAGTFRKSPASGLHYRAIFESSLDERVCIAKAGLMPLTVKTLSSDMKMDQNKVALILGVPRATLNRKLKARQRLDVPVSERVLGLVRLVGQVKKMVEESGNPEGFDAPTWVGEWLERPLPALGGRKPGEFMDTASGQELVSNLLAQTQAGVYA